MRQVAISIFLLSLLSSIAWGQESNDFRPAETNVWGAEYPRGRNSCATRATPFPRRPGESQTVHVELKERDLSMVTETGAPIIAKGKYSVSVGGGQPNTEAPSVSGTFQVKGTKRLPE